MKNYILLLFISIGFLFSCDKEKVDPASSILGKWKQEYRILDDGSKSYDSRYALLEHTYNDGFILYENKTGNTIIGDRINDVEFEWEFKNSRLFITVPYQDGRTEELEYVISNFEGDSMNIQTPKGFRYFLKRE